jgi:hypothetical protein
VRAGSYARALFQSHFIGDTALASSLIPDETTSHSTKPINGLVAGYSRASMHCLRHSFVAALSHLRTGIGTTMKKPIADSSLSFASLSFFLLRGHFFLLSCLVPGTAIIRPFDITGNYRV